MSNLPDNHADNHADKPADESDSAAGRHADSETGGDEQARGEAPQPRPLSVWQIFASTLAAAFGVQSSKNRERDFSQGKASHFIIAGVVFTVLFVLVMVLVVSAVLSGVG